MKIVVGTTPVVVPVDHSYRLVVRNLGPGVVYLEHAAELATPAAGFPLKVDDAYEFPAELTLSGPLFLSTDTAGTDVRVLVVG